MECAIHTTQYNAQYNAYCRRNTTETVNVKYGLSLQHIEMDEEKEAVSALVYENYVRIPI